MGSPSTAHYRARADLVHDADMDNCDLPPDRPSTKSQRLHRVTCLSIGSQLSLSWDPAGYIQGYIHEFPVA